MGARKMRERRRIGVTCYTRITANIKGVARMKQNRRGLGLVNSHTNTTNSISIIPNSLVVVKYSVGRSLLTFYIPHKSIDECGGRGTETFKRSMEAKYEYEQGIM